jgi:hypothetical protein
LIWIDVISTLHFNILRERIRNRKYFESISVTSSLMKIRARDQHGAPHRRRSAVERGDAAVMGVKLSSPLHHRVDRVLIITVTPRCGDDLAQRGDRKPGY